MAALVEHGNSPNTISPKAWDVLERACTRYAIELDQCLDQRIEAQARLVAILRSLPDCQQKLEMQKVLELHDQQLRDWEVCLFSNVQHGNLALENVTNLMPDLTLHEQHKEERSHNANSSKPPSQCLDLKKDGRPVTSHDSMPTAEKPASPEKSKPLFTEGSYRQENTKYKEAPVGPKQQRRRQGKSQVHNHGINV